MALHLRPTRYLQVAVLALGLTTTISADPSSLSPRGTHVELHVAKENASWFARQVQLLSKQGVLHFAEPVHEEITARMYGCDDGCDDADVASDYATYVIAGVRWNDDPPFRLHEGEGQHTTCKTDETIRFTTQPQCWYQLFSAAKRQAEAGDVPDAEHHAPLVARSHFGDLQFFHAMASQDGELASETQARIMMWMEFTWKVGNREYGLDTKLSDVNIAGFERFFGKSGWTVQDLFTGGNPALRRYVDDVAFGSLLHTVEDSFAEGHVLRDEATSGECPNMTLPAPPRITEFHSYAHQDQKKHKEKDSRGAFIKTLHEPVNVVSIGEPIIGFSDAHKKWEEVKPYFECIFAVVDPNHTASAGQEFKHD